MGSEQEVEAVRAARSAANMMQFFSYEHLPEHLKPISKVYHDTAEWMVQRLPANEQRTEGLKHLLAVKDCAVRSFISK